MEKEKESTLDAVEELRGSLHAEKRERASYIRSSESRLAGLENNVHLLQEERRLGKREFEEELDKAVNAQIEIFILQKFIQDLEEKNLTVYIECQRHVEASKFSDKLIKELESENLELQVEEEFLVEEIEKLRLGIYQVFRALQIETDTHEDKLSEKKRRRDRVSKTILEQEYEVMVDSCAMLQTDKHDLLEMQGQLRLEVTAKEQKEEILEAELETFQGKLGSLQAAYLGLQEEQSRCLKRGDLA
ncbi:hypothetical protein M0R45_018189 [Rubus argutus]|uniref:Uncharacterized protein n=1 Tax=Rubus argutus TaxID=59490 RepID=A0AAW1X4F3_RUBAR